MRHTAKAANLPRKIAKGISLSAMWMPRRKAPSGFEWRLVRACAAVLKAACLASGCSGPSEDSGQNAPTADAIYFNGEIYTLDAQDNWAEALAVREGVLLAIGEDAEVLAHQGERTQMVDLAGRMAMPGIQDMHMHPVEGGIKALHECGFADSLSAREIAHRVRDCATDVEPGAWIQGGQWGPGLLEGDTSALLGMLDAVSPDNPVFLMDWALHNAWVNSLALAELGIDGHTPNPMGGVIMRNPQTGAANGVLLDNAAYEAKRKLPYYSTEQVAEALAHSIERMVRHGVTSYKDAMVSEQSIAGYHALAAQGGLRVRVKTSLAWKSAWSPSHIREAELIDNHAALARERLDTRFAKIMVDGIPPTYTAAVLAPYAPSAQFGDAHFGKLMLTPEELIEDVTALDAQGLTVKMHATGDRSVRLVLDAVAAARRANGHSGLRHEVSHAEMIDPDDLPRFAALNVAAEMCPVLWHPSRAVDAMRTALGERAERFWPVRALVESGALVFYGSDWPSVAPDTNPWPGIEAMVTRADPLHRFPGALWSDQAVDLSTALRIFTYNGAVAGRQEQETGSLEAGKQADFIILDRNPFAIPAADISEVQVLRTVVGGVEVHRAD